MLSLKSLISLLGIQLWVLSIHAGIFTADNMLPRPTTGDGGKYSDKYSARYLKYNGEPRKVHLKITPEDLNRSISFGTGVVDRLKRLETNLDWSDIRIKQGTPAHGQLIESAPDTKALIQGKHALIASKATIHLMSAHCLRHKLSPSDCAKHVSKYKLTNTPLHHFCSEVQKMCSAEEILSNYRSLDGSCNNNPEGSRGQSFTNYKRLLHPDYLDGVQEPRRSVHKKHPLPSPRKVSIEVVRNQNVIDEEHTLALMEWTEFVSHDLSHTVISKMVHSGKTIECCSSYGTNLSPRYIHPFCAPISVPADDMFYSKYNLKCMSYVRSVPALRSDCTFGPIEQLNQATHFLDASELYASDDKKALSLRSLEGGKLKYSAHHGDSRVNMQPHMTVMQTLWLREHNRIAGRLGKLNPHWKDETLYQQARRIVIAEMQHITYDHWIPEILGNKYISWLKTDAPENYVHDVDPSVSNSFATAAIRFVKSLAVGKLGLYNEDRVLNHTISLSEHFNKPMIIESDDFFDALIRGLATQNSQKLDLDYVTDVTNQLYRSEGVGFDVLSLNIQRGRDHGIPSYTAYRSLCGLPNLQTFKDFLDVMPAQIVESLAGVYKNPDDVDLIVGGLAEHPDGESFLGPTFSCIIADQFQRTRYGDRYFYTHSDQPMPFTRHQLDEINKSSLARIFCDNGDDIGKMQPNVFRKLSNMNNLVNCSASNIPHMDLNYWMDSRSS